MNPSTADLLAAIEATPATEVLVLPNNSNVILSAEQAAELATKPVRVIPSRSVPAGLAAIVRYLPALDAAENEAAMLEALEQVATGEVTVASRDVELDGVEVQKGAWLGLVDGTAVASSPDFDEVASAVAERLLADGREMLTLLTGEDEPRSGRAARAGSGSGTRASRSRCSRAASPTTRCSSPRSSAMVSAVEAPPADPRPARRGQRRLPPGARAAPRAAGRDRGRRLRRRGGRGGRRVQGARPGRRA